MSDSERLISKLINDKPMFHTWSELPPVGPEILRFIARNVSRGMTTLETGAGHTTVIFAIAGARHTCIAPANDEFDKIVAYCSRAGVDLSGVRFIDESSDRALPRDGTVPSELDFVFIDGAHRLPFPLIDYHYTGASLKVGGLLGLDDMEMPSVRQLYTFLDGEDEWELVDAIHDAAFFRKIAHVKIIRDWAGQKINRKENWATPNWKPHWGKRIRNKTVRVVRALGLR